MAGWNATFGKPAIFVARPTCAAFALEHDASAGVANWNAASRARLSRATRLVLRFRSSPLLAAYAAWCRVYDGFDAERRGLGVKEHAVYQSVDNPNDVTV
jgi:hypothetical protein